VPLAVSYNFPLNSFAECPPTEEGPIQIGIIAFDDACSLPLSDTLRVNVNIERPANADPRFTTADVFTTPPVNEGTDPVVFPIEAVDDDGDEILVNYVNDGFDLASVGMSLNTIRHEDGSYQSQLVWDPKCNIYDFTQRTSFQIKVLIEDRDKCLYPNPDMMQLDLQIKLPGNADPVISTDLVPDELASSGMVVNTKIFENLEFNVFGRDLIDRDKVILTGEGVGFNMNQYLISFPGDTDDEGDARSQFQWNFTCQNLNLNEKDEFDFRFIVVDNANKCRFYKADTLNVKVVVAPPDNLKPELTVTNTNPQLQFDNANILRTTLGQQISLGLISVDGDISPTQDEVSIELLSAEGEVAPTGYNFAPVKGVGTAQTTFTWNPDCSLFQNGDYENDYVFTFRTIDNRCFSNKADTVKVNITIRDVESSSEEFLPPNYISPNGDGLNDFFAMVRLIPDDSNGFQNILPIDNCVRQFKSISIYNRWGNEVFSSQSREFRWVPSNEPAGIYFYTVTYTDVEFKGTITLQN
jgi:hypothetical protein